MIDEELEVEKGYKNMNLFGMFYILVQVFQLHKCILQR